MATKPGRPRKLASGPLHDRYQELEGKGWSASNIWRTLSDEYPDLAPDLRTIQRYVAEDRSLDKSGPWRLWMSDPEDVPAIFESLGTAMHVSDGEVRWLSAAEAEWIGRIGRIGVHIDPFGKYLMARQFARAQAKDSEDYMVDLLFGITTELLPEAAQEMMAGQSLIEWMLRGPRQTAK